MPINQRLFDADQSDRLSGSIERGSLEKKEKTIVNPSRLTKESEPLRPKLKNKEKQPTCTNCGEEHLGMCMKPPKPKP